MNIRTITIGEFQANCHLVWTDLRQALVIDPGDEAGRIMKILDDERLTVAAYLLTHGHMDHISAVAELVETRPASVAIHPAELEWAFGPNNQWPPFYDIPRRPSRLDRPLADGAESTDGGIAWRVIATPGHTPGSVSIHIPAEKALFTGDTLFAGSVGRTDLLGGDSRQLRKSLSSLARLPDDTAVYSGHGPETSIGDEKRHNYFMQEARHIP